MKVVDVACTAWLITLLIVSSTTAADTSMQTAMATCREEAVSTGLVEEADINHYIDLCMQAWQDPAGYTEGELGGNYQPDMQTDTSEQASP